MSSRPTLHGERVLLRPFTRDDAPRVVELAGAREIADTTLAIPHPYPPEVAVTWIDSQDEAWDLQRALDVAIADAATGELVGAIGLGLNPAHNSAEMGYWVGVAYWNRGYCTDAARALRDFGFDELALHRIVAHHLVRNPASGRVMQKIGMQFEGIHRGAVKKWDVYEDVAAYAILVDDWRALGG
jgi:RimJ/RimL family protein N-acetyltransferase